MSVPHSESKYSHFEYSLGKTPTCFLIVHILISSYACIPQVNVESPHCQRIRKRTAFSSMLLTDTLKPEIPHFEMLTIIVSFYLSDCLSVLTVAFQQIVLYHTDAACRNNNNFLRASDQTRCPVKHVRTF